MDRCYVGPGRGTFDSSPVLSSPSPPSLGETQQPKVALGSGEVVRGRLISSGSFELCSVRAERAPGSPPRRRFLLTLREPSEWSSIVLVI
ncbi:unnamed protein product [Gadus morhua 'NCC']